MSGSFVEGFVLADGPVIFRRLKRGRPTVFVIAHSGNMVLIFPVCQSQPAAVLSHGLGQPVSGSLPCHVEDKYPEYHAGNRNA
jgi:hypothetical protein